MIYKGEIGPIPIAVKRWDGGRNYQGEKQFLTELQVLFEYKHENIIGLVGYCNENNEKILVYEYASNGSLDKHLNDATLTWTQRLKIGIDIATGLEFLHGGGSPVIHVDIKSSNILLTGDWNGKIADFGLSMITVMDKEIDFVVDAACGTLGYIDPLVRNQGFFTRESDIYSLGVVLFEMMCGTFAYLKNNEDEERFLGPFVKLYYEEGKADELVFEGIKNKIVPNSLTTFQRIAYQCLSDVREERPSASEVVLQLKKALEFQVICLLFLHKLMFFLT
ncbi:putative protein kinase RLK-Pelle-CR4L family [Helianthus annuus]|nr:putative protein kinase RLK-Pelle-CR4L family [Helianthus annuus]